MAERGIVVSHTTIMRWVLRYVPNTRNAGPVSRRPWIPPGAWMRLRYLYGAAFTTRIAQSTNTGEP